MNKNGFTLIELLAVIVILAIIALIAVPVLLNIINDTKTSSEEQSVELYIDSVKKAISRKQLEDTSFNPTECTIKDNGNLLCNNIEVIVDMKGIKPKKGIIEIKDNKVTYKNLLLNGTYYNRLVTSVQDNNNNGKPDIGDKYTYKVNDKDTFNFYVLSFNEDDTVNLIMDRNICEDGTGTSNEKITVCTKNWYRTQDNTYGPVNAINFLYSSTKDWNNVPDIFMNYYDENNTDSDTEGYTSIITKNGETIITGKPTTKVSTIGTMSNPLKARIPKEKEIKQTGCEVYVNGSCPAWLVENLRYENVENDKYSINSENTIGKKLYSLRGYWLLSSYKTYDSYVTLVINNGYIRHGFPTTDGYGIRPVITVPKSYLEY